MFDSILQAPVARNPKSEIHHEGSKDAKEDGRSRDFRRNKAQKSHTGEEI